MDSSEQKASRLLDLKNRLDEREKKQLCRFATLSSAGIRRRERGQTGHRQAFALDADRILHSKAFRRLKHFTMHCEM